MGSPVRMAVSPKASSAVRRTSIIRSSSSAAVTPLSQRCTSGWADPAGRASWSVMKVIPISIPSWRMASSAASSSVPGGKSV